MLIFINLKINLNFFLAIKEVFKIYSNNRFYLILLSLFLKN